MISEITFEMLAAHHDRQNFDCGNDELNNFLKTQARQKAEKHLARTHLVVSKKKPSEIRAYYTLSSQSVPIDLFPVSGLPRNPVGVTLLGRLAVDLRYQKQGLGSVCLLRAMRQTRDVALSQIATFSLVVDAKDDQGKAWCEKFGFEALRDDPLHLYIATKTILTLDFEDF